MNATIVIFVVLAILVAILVGALIAELMCFQRWKRKFRQEMLFRPQKADDYTKPRYVYDSYVESEEYNPLKYGKLRGYRISPELVINNRLQSVNGTIAQNYYYSTLLNEKELGVLLDNYDALSALQKKAGEQSFDLTVWIWATYKGHLAAIKLQKSQYQWSGKDDVYPAIRKW